jgi:hypothetical protein
MIQGYVLIADEYLNGPITMTDNMATHTNAEQLHSMSSWKLCHDPEEKIRNISPRNSEVLVFVCQDEVKYKIFQRCRRGFLFDEVAMSSSTNI